MTKNYNWMYLCSLLFIPIVLISSFVSPPSFTSKQQRQRQCSSCSKYASKVKEESRTTAASTLTEGRRSTSSSQHANYELLIRDNDILPAIKAVRKACSVTHRLQEVLCPKAGCLAKEDSTPVTIADYAAQAIVLDNLRTYFPADAYLAEESSKELLSQSENENKDIVQQIVQAVQSVQGPFTNDLEYVLESIDLGQSFYDDEDNERCWTLDPIDGTKGFLRGVDNGQYCVALCLLVNGVPEIGILGCPNLHMKGQNNNASNNKKGCMFIAKRNKGCYQIPLCFGDDDDSTTTTEADWIQNVIPNTIKQVHVTKNDESEIPLQDAKFCIGVEKYSDPTGQGKAMATLIHGPDAMNEEDGSIIKAIKMDSQAKYGVIARGEAQVYLRLPKAGYVEWIWDHAAGSIITQEAGGKITDVDGNPLDFSLGPKLSPDVKGIVGTNGGIFHDAVLNAYQTQKRETEKKMLQ